MIEFKDYITYDENDIPKDVLEAAIKFENIERNVNKHINISKNNCSGIYDDIIDLFKPNDYLTYKKIRDNLKPRLLIPIVNIIENDIVKNKNFMDHLAYNILKILK